MLGALDSQSLGPGSILRTEVWLSIPFSLSPVSTDYDNLTLQYINVICTTRITKYSNNVILNLSAHYQGALHVKLALVFIKQLF